MEKEKQVELLHKTINGVLKGFANSIKDGSDFIPVDSYVPENFYNGTDKFLKIPSKNGKWSLGYANVNLTPVDYAKRAYYMGGYISPDNKFKNLIEEVIDDMQGRAIALDDGSG